MNHAALIDPYLGSPNRVSHRVRTLSTVCACWAHWNLRCDVSFAEIRAGGGLAAALGFGPLDCHKQMAELFYEYVLHHPTSRHMRSKHEQEKQAITQAVAAVLRGPWLFGLPKKFESQLKNF